MEDLKPLVQQAQAGNLEAYGEIVRQLQDMAYGYAFSVLGDFHLAQDAAQEAFIQAYRDLHMLREPAAFPGWFRRIVLKHCDRIQRQRRPRTRSLDLTSGEPVSDELGPVEAAEKRELKDRVLAAVRKLPEHQRTVTTLFYIDGYSVNDIANFLEAPVGTVKRRLYDSRKELKERMVAMVAEELNASKPNADFRTLVEKAIKLQDQQRFAGALRIHGEALDVSGPDDVPADLVADSYYLLSPSYRDAGRMLELAQGIVSGLPSRAPAGQERTLLQRHMEAAVAFAKAKAPVEAARCGQRIVDTAETIRGCPDFRFWRNEGLWALWRAAQLQGSQEHAAQLMHDIQQNLSACEEDVHSACPGLRSKSDTEDKGLRSWFQWAGDAHHNHAHHLVYWAQADKREGLTFMRKAAALRDSPPTEGILAAWILSAEKDREAALARLREAREKYAEPGLFRNQFYTMEDFEPVREDADFLAVLGE